MNNLDNDPFYDGFHPGDVAVPLSGWFVALVSAAALTILVVLAFLAGPARGQVLAGCLTPQAALSTMENAPAEGRFAKFEVIEGAAAIRQADKLFGADDDNDQISDMIYAFHPKLTWVRVIWFKDGCYDGHTNVNLPYFENKLGRRAT